MGRLIQSQMTVAKDSDLSAERVHQMVEPSCQMVMESRQGRGLGNVE